MRSGIFRRRELQSHQSVSPMNDGSSYVARHVSELDVLSAVGAVVNASKGRGVTEFVHCEDIRGTWLRAIDRALLERHLVRLLQFSPSLEDARKHVRSDPMESDKGLDVYTALIHYTVFSLINPDKELLLRPERLMRALYCAREKTLPLLMSWLFKDEKDNCVLNDGVERKVLDGIRSTVLREREATRAFITEQLCALEKQTPTAKATHIPETFICDRGDAGTVGMEALLNELMELRYKSSRNAVDKVEWEDILDPSLRCRVYSESSGRMKYQWLPTDFRVGVDGDVTTLSPLHGSVHPRDFPALYAAIPRFLGDLLPLFERVLGSIATLSPPVSYGVGIGSSHISNRNVSTNEPVKSYNLKGRQLQVVVKLSTVRLDKAHPVFASDSDRQFNRGWKQESDNHEHIVAVGYYVLRCRNITPPKLAFRAFAHCPEDSGLTSQEDSFLAFGERTSAFYGGRYGRQVLQPWGSLALHEGRSIVVPSFLVHRVEPFELSNASEDGELTIATFYLVDPSDEPIVSTRTVRPDQWQQTQSFVRANVDVLRCCSSIPFSPDEIAHKIVSFASSHVSECQAQLSRLELLAHRQKMQELRFLTPSLRLSEMKLELDSDEGTTKYTCGGQKATKRSEDRRSGAVDSIDYHSTVLQMQQNLWSFQSFENSTSTSQSAQYILSSGLLLKTLCPPNLEIMSESIAKQYPFFTSITTKVGLGEGLSQADTRRKGSNPSLRNLSYRERERIYKQRYRIKQQAFQDDLEKANKQLLAEIKQVQVRLERLPYAISKSSTMWTVATEYFRLFQCGLHSRNETPTAQLDFLQAMISPDIGAGTVQSVATLRMERVVDCTLIATATISVTLSRHSLVNLFPHLFYGGVVRGMQATQSRVYRIAKKLIDQRLVLNGSVRFGWDNVNHRVETLDSEFDMASPLLQLLDSVEDVAFVFNGALVTPSFNVIPTVSPELENNAVNMMEAWT